jgi:DNA polymerase elongation subunit (family B)
MTRKKPNILIFDIETSPNIVYSWAVGQKINIGHENIIEERQVICIAYKWSGQSRTHALKWDPRKTHDKDKVMLREFSKIYNSADMVVAHNGDNFDIKWINARILYHGLPPLSVVKQCDTLKEFRRTFKLNSNRLDYVSKFLGYDGKSVMSFSDWINVMNGSRDALTKMVKYCKKDVIELDLIFQQTRPYIKDGNIHQAVKSDRGACPSCGSLNAVNKHGFYYTKIGKFQKYRCQECFHNWRDGRQVKG